MSNEAVYKTAPATPGLLEKHFKCHQLDNVIFCWPLYFCQKNNKYIQGKYIFYPHYKTPLGANAYPPKVDNFSFLSPSLQDNGVFRAAYGFGLVY